MAPEQQAEPLCFLTCGSVDDGKSTLIGRLLHESELISEDTLASLLRDSRRYGTTGDEPDLALLLDGLEAERQQGITIDVAYRFFRTPRRSFIAADTPGHEQYTRNMATGASSASLAIILIDARKGVLTQTRRHSHICSLLGIRDIVVAVNKIDLVDFSEETFRRVVSEYAAFASELGFRSIVPIPVSARYGDNVTRCSGRTPWYQGPPLLGHLEEVETSLDLASKPFRFPVQWVSRPSPDFRGFAGTVASGRIAPGEEVVIAASDRRTRVLRIVTADGDLPAAEAGQAVTLTLEDEVDVARGDLLVRPAERPAVASQFAGHLLWMDEAAMLPGRSYLMRMGNSWTPCSVTSIRHRVDADTLAKHAARRLALNEIGFCNFTAAQPVPLDSYEENRATGRFILVDRFTNRTAGAGMVAFPLRRATNIRQAHFTVDKAARAVLTGQKAMVLWFTGLSGSGKSTIANIVEHALHRAGRQTYTLDGDNIRDGLCRDLGFTAEDRVENIRRVGEVAKLMVDAGLIVLCAFISPFHAERRMVRDLLGEGEFLEIFVDTPLETCIGRDPKGLYAKARAGQIKNFTGIDSPYEPPEAPDIHISTQGETAEASARYVLERLRDLGAPSQEM